MTRRNGGKELGEALLRGSAPMLAVEYDDDGIPKDLKPAEIMAFLNKLEAYNMTQVAEKDKLLALLAMTPEWIEFMETFDAIRTVLKDSEDPHSEMVSLLSYGALNPERPADRKKCLEWDVRVSKELRKEFGRASDHSTYYDALSKLWAGFKPTISGPAVDLASMKMRMEVVTKNAKGHSLKDLSEEETQQLFDWMQKGLRVYFPELSTEMEKTPKDSKPTDFNKWMQEVVAAGKAFEKQQRLFGDYFRMHPTIKVELEEKDRQLAELQRKVQQLERGQNTGRGGEKPTNRGGEKPAARGGEKPSEQTGKSGKEHNPNIECFTCKKFGHPAWKCPQARQGGASNSSQQGGSNPQPQQQPTRRGSTSAVQWTGSSPDEQYSPRTKREFDAYRAGRESRD